MNSDLDLLLDSYDYHLPTELVASRPCLKRDGCRLLVYKRSSNQIIHSHFEQLRKFLPESSLLVLNSSKVIPCRLIGNKPTGARVEIFVLSKNKNKSGYPSLIQSSRKKRQGETILLDDDYWARIENINADATFDVMFFKGDFPVEASVVLDELGGMPIPPYIRDGESDWQDKSDYQTVFAKDDGSVAAPTAGLHFTEELLQQLEAGGVSHCFVNLHVGLGTFAPVKEQDLTNHKMHSETFSIPESTLVALRQHRLNHHPVIAVGTTALRTLESSFDIGVTPDESYSTDIFLHPGKKVRSIDGLITNFHLPKSTLLMLVASLIGREKVLSIYQEAIKERYRFFSYGDAMLIVE